MSYEIRIGLRYLWRGRKTSGAIPWLLLLGILVTVGGAALTITSGGASGWGVIATALGMASVITLCLLWLLSVFATVSVLGVILGVAALMTVLAVTTGMQQQFRAKVLGVNAHVIIQKQSFNFTEYRDKEKQILENDSRVVAVQAFNFLDMVATNGRGDAASVQVKGVEPDRVDKVLDLHKYMVEGTVDGLQGGKTENPPMILGRVLAERLGAKVGDVLTVVAPLSNYDLETGTVRDEAPRSMKFEVVGVFYAGFDEYDRHLIYISLADSQELIGQGDQVQGLELKVEDVDEADEVRKQLGVLLGLRDYKIQDWNQLNANLFTALALQKLMLIIILTLIIGIAAFNIVSALTMMVTDKTREIAILRSMGATSGGVGWIFQVLGVGIGCVGTVWGLGFGLVLCKLMQHYDYPLDPQVYLIDRLPIQIEFGETLLVGAITMVICAVATVFPARKASALMPIEGLRHD